MTKMQYYMVQFTVTSEGFAIPTFVIYKSTNRDKLRERVEEAARRIESDLGMPTCVELIVPVDSLQEAYKICWEE